MNTDHPSSPAASDVERYRPRLFGIAYRMLSDVQEAEDLVHETFLRWHQAKHGDVVSEEGWLVAVITRLAIDRLRRAERERLRYAIGPRYPGVLSDDGLVVLFTHPGDAQWTEVVPLEYLEEAPEAPKPRRRGK